MNETTNGIRIRLMKGRDPNAKGMWTIYGEDPNCDFGGSHHEPTLEVVYGTYKNIVEYALSLNSFIVWGAGGRIEKILEQSQVRNVDSLFTAKSKKLQSEKEKLQARIAEIDTELKG